MALDTREKRAQATNLFTPLPRPDPEAETSADRAQITWTFFLPPPVAVPPPFTPPTRSTLLTGTIPTYSRLSSHTIGGTRMGQTFFIKQSDTLPKIRETLYDLHGIVDLVPGSSVAFHMRLPGAPSAKVNAPATIIQTGQGDNAVDKGVVEYAWIASDTDTADAYLREWQITFPGGQVMTVPDGIEGYLTLVTPQLA